MSRCICKSSDRFSDCGRLGDIFSHARGGSALLKKPCSLAIHHILLQRYCNPELSRSHNSVRPLINQDFGGLFRPARINLEQILEAAEATTVKLQAHLPTALFSFFLKTVSVTTEIRFYFFFLLFFFLASDNNAVFSPCKTPVDKLAA